MRTRFRFIAFALILLLAAVPAAAQDDEPNYAPLLDMLAQIPDTEASRAGLLSYVDYRAAELARPGAAQPESWQEWDALMDEESDAAGLWLGAFQGVTSGPASFTQNLMRAGDLVNLAGFDAFDVDRGIEYGEPPANGILFGGDFASDTIQAAYADRAYTAVSTDSEDITLLCQEGDCTTGMMTNLAERNPEIPFGGELGRNQPLLIASGYLFSSADWDVVQQHLALYAGEQSSLADAPEYQAAAEAISQGGRVIQVYLVDPAELHTELPESPDLGDAAELPPYELLALVDTATEEEQVAMVLLVYDDAASTQQAASAVPERLSTMASLRTEQPFADLLADRSAEVESSVFESEETGKSVAIITLRAPLASSDASDRIEASSMVYRLLVQMLFSRDTTWLLSESLLDS